MKKEMATFHSDLKAASAEQGVNMPPCFTAILYKDARSTASNATKAFPSRQLNIVAKCQ